MFSTSGAPMKNKLLIPVRMTTKLYVLVCNAYDAMHPLSVEIHYLSCDGVGNPPKKRTRRKIPLQSRSTAVRK
jgi:hypothetical protein